MEDLLLSGDGSAGVYDGLADSPDLHPEMDALETCLRLHFGSGEGRIALDAGGGTGRWSIRLASWGWKVHLLDISPICAELARRKARDLGLELETVVGNAEETPFPEKTFDLVLAEGAVVSFTPRPVAFLEECRRVLKPGGILWLCFANRASGAHTRWRGVADPGCGIPGRMLVRESGWDLSVREFDRRAMEEAIRSAGFRIESTYGAPAAPGSEGIPRSCRLGEDESCLVNADRLRLAARRLR
jgi:SAM-dependent methyltransferase